MRPENQGQKHLIMRDVAREVTKYGADAVIVISEVWTSPFDPQKAYQRAANSPERQEALAAELVTKGGKSIEWTARIQRDGRRLSLGETHVDREGISFSFAPVYEAWGRAVPDHWMKAVKSTLGGLRSS